MQVSLIKSEPRPLSANVHDAIAGAERILPGRPSPEGLKDPRWQAIIEIANFIESNPEEIWTFILRWGSHKDADLRAAVATCLLEHLLDYYFDRFFPKVERAIKADPLFADMFLMSAQLGQSTEPAKALRFDRLKNEASRLVHKAQRPTGIARKAKRKSKGRPRA